MSRFSFRDKGINIMPAGRPASNPDESPRDKFRKAANTRVNTALAQLTSIAKLNVSTNEYTESDVNSIMTALRSKCDEVEKILLSEDAAIEGFALPADE